MLILIATLGFLAQEPDTLAAATVSAALQISPPSEKAGKEVLERTASLADAVRDFSGVQLRDYGGVGGLKTVNVRSLGSAHTAIFLDGVPIDNAQNMQPDLGRIDSDDLESLELYAGQKSELLQSAREFGSASSLHIRSAMPRERHIRFRLRGGSFGTVSPSVALEGPLKGRLSGRIRFGGDVSNGQYPFHVTGYSGASAYDTVMVRENSDLKAFRAQAGLWFTPSRGRYELHGSWYDSERGIPGPVYKQASAYRMSEDRQADRALALQASGEQRLSESLTLLARAKYSRDVLQYMDISEQDPSVSAEWDYLLQSAYVSGSLGWQALEWLHLGAAIDGQVQTLDAQVDARRSEIYTAVSAAVLKDPWRASMALQWMASDDGYSFLSPSFILDWHPREDWEFGALVKRSCRLPSFNDLYYTNVTARALKPEQVWQVSARWCWDRSYGPWHFRAREELYHNRVTDKLIAVPNGSLFRWSMYNIGTVKIYGDELLAEASYMGLAGLTARYSYQRAYNPEDGLQIPYIPLHSASFNVFVCREAFRADVRGSLTGVRLTSASSRPEYRLNPWFTLDAALSWTPSARLRLSLDLKNITGEQYQIVLGYPMPGFNFLGTVAITL